MGPVMEMPTNMREAEGRLIESLAEHVRKRNPDMREDAVLREARKLYEGPVYPPTLGPVGLRMRDFRNREIMREIRACSPKGQRWLD